MDFVYDLPEEIRDSIFKYVDIGPEFRLFSNIIFAKKQINDHEYIKIKKYYMIIHRKFKLNAPPKRKNMLNSSFLFERFYKLVMPPGVDYTVKSTFVCKVNEINHKKLMNVIIN